MEVCRICLDLQHTGSFDPLDGLTMDMVSLLAPEMNLDISDDPVICKSCSAPLEDLFNFKSTFLQNEDKLEGKIDKDKDPYIDPPDLRDILKGSQAVADQMKAKEKFCRTCFELIDCDTFSCLDPSTCDVYLSCMMNMCLPEMDLKLTKNPLMCESCLDKVQKLHHLKSNCLETEKKLNTYCDLHGTNSSGKVNLSTILNSDMAKKAPEVLDDGDVEMLGSRGVMAGMTNASEFLAVEVKSEALKGDTVNATKTVNASNGTISHNNSLQITQNSDIIAKKSDNLIMRIGNAKKDFSSEFEEIKIKSEIMDASEIKEEEEEEEDK